MYIWQDNSTRCICRVFYELQELFWMSLFFVRWHIMFGSMLGFGGVLILYIFVRCVHFLFLLMFEICNWPTCLPWLPVLESWQDCITKEPQMINCWRRSPHVLHWNIIGMLISLSKAIEPLCRYTTESVMYGQKPDLWIPCPLVTVKLYVWWHENE